MASQQFLEKKVNIQKIDINMAYYCMYDENLPDSHVLETIISLMLSLVL